MPYDEKTKTLIQIIKKHPVLSQIIARETLDNRSIIHFFPVNPSLITAQRRLSTMVAWKKWIDAIEKPTN
jgi:hypothetical protein